jgi:argininosuccinate lyase
MKRASQHQCEDILMSLDQLDQTLEVLGLVIRKLKFNIEELTLSEQETLPSELPELLEKLKVH